MALSLFLQNLRHITEILEIEGERWRVVEWTGRIECERVVS